MKKIIIIFGLTLLISGCRTMDLQPGMSIGKVNTDFYVFCNSKSPDGQYLVLQGNYEYDSSIKVYKINNPSGTRYHLDVKHLCEKTLYFKDGVLVSEQKIKEMNDIGEKNKRDIEERIQLKKQSMIDFVEANKLQVLDEFKNLDESKFKIYVNTINQRFYSKNYEFVDEKSVATEIAMHQREEVERKERDVIEKNRIASNKIMQIEKEKQTQEKEKNVLQFKRKFESLRKLAAVDSVSQALNYSHGYPENSSGYSFWYPVANRSGQCIYERSPIMSIHGKEQDTGYQIDLNKGNPQTLKVIKTTGINPEWGRMGPITSYSVSVEGLGSIYCGRECDPDRLYRAWKLIYSKCAGKKTNF